MSTVESTVETPKENTESENNVIKEYSDLSVEIDNILKSLVEKVRVLKNIKKDLDKSHTKELKNVKKKKKGGGDNKTNKEPSGFNKPAIVPVEFCEQPWGCEKGELIPRTQLTKMVYDYIKDNNLQDPKDKRIIHPDKNVKLLFHLDEGIDLEFKTFQTYMAKLYKKTKEENVVVEPVVAEPVKQEKPKKKRVTKKSQTA